MDNRIYLKRVSTFDDHSTPLPPDLFRTLPSHVIPSSKPVIRNPMPKPRDSMHTPVDPDIRQNINSGSIRSMAAPYFSSFPIAMPSSSASSSTSLSSGIIQYPTAIYPFQHAASNELKQLTLAQYSSINTQPGFPADLTKLKSPFINRNYLELAMLVCNTFRGKLFPCSHCRYVTDRRNNLKRHISTMHQACDKVLECCGVNFTTKASLREHIMIFHHNGYSCAFCGRRFCRKALLKRHLSVHSGQKDYSCPHCDYATSHKSNLERHKRIHERLRCDDEESENSQTHVDVEQGKDNVSDHGMNNKLTREPFLPDKNDAFTEKVIQQANEEHEVDVESEFIDVNI